MSLYSQRIFGESVLPGYAGALDEARVQFRLIAQRFASGGLPAISICNERVDIEAATTLTRRLRQDFEHVVILGVGGSSLGGQALTQLQGNGTALQGLENFRPKLHFLDNLDAPTFSRMLDLLPPAHTHFVAISKSGTTAETLMQVLTVLEALKSRGVLHRSKFISVVTEAKSSPLRALAQENGFQTLEHPNDIGGRFSVLTIVGLLPAMLANLDVQRVRSGAATAWKAFLEQDFDASVVSGAAFCVAGARAGRIASVIMPYSDRLERFAEWFRQLWAESLGKAGKGTLPVNAIGPVDQHSQLQFYLDGPDCAVFTLMFEACRPTTSKIAAPPSINDLAYLDGRTMQDLVNAEARATAETLIAHRRPCRIFEFGNLNEEIIGALFTHCMVETMICAGIIGVNAFDQPAVEDGKVRARKYLSDQCT